MKTALYHIDGRVPVEYSVLAENPPTKDKEGNVIPGTLDLGTVDSADEKKTTLVVGKCPVSIDGKHGTCTDPTGQTDAGKKLKTASAAAEKAQDLQDAKDAKDAKKH